MRLFKIVIVCVLLAAVSSCDQERLSTDNTVGNAVIVKLINDDTWVLTLGSAFQGGSLMGPETAGLRCRMFHEYYTSCPNVNLVEYAVYIGGIIELNKEYSSEPSNSINIISIKGLDESLGLGTLLDIPMNQGKYEGGNELVEDVQINSYKYSTLIDEDDLSLDYTSYNKDADIDILIKLTTGGAISIHYANAATPYDGYQ